MKRPAFITGLFLFLIVISMSCVPAKKYESLQSTSRQYMLERDNFRKENLNLSMSVRELQSKVESLEKETAELKADLDVAG